MCGILKNGKDVFCIALIVVDYKTVTGNDELSVTQAPAE